MNNSNGKVPIYIIDTEQKLADCIEQVKTSAELFIDTEFDDFNNQYGVHLQLIQVYNGSCCFLIDTIRISDLTMLWSVLEDEHTCKVLYSGANDIAILKKYGCYTRNIFDLQVAAQLCNRPERSYAALVHAALGVEINKSLQRSNWGNRPLHPRQLEYASQDVICLQRLKELLLPEIIQKKLLHVLQEENRLIESAVKKDYEPRLTGKQQKIFNGYARKKLMEFKILVDRYARKLNVPPYYIVQDSVLTSIMMDKMSFLDQPFHTGFYRAVLKDEQFKKQFLAIVHAIDPSKCALNPVKDKGGQSKN